MARLRDIVIAGEYRYEAGGGYEFVADFPARYIADLTARPKLTRRLKVVAACGNGTAGAFAPKLLSALGAEVVPLDCDLDFTFPHYNPNPEDMQMLHAMAAAVTQTGADVALGFDGDGDRCGVVDNEGARDLRRQDRGHAGARSLEGAPECDLCRRRQVDGAVHDRSGPRANGVKVDFWKTGHSHIKRRVRDLNALAGFEKSGHFFFNAPIGRGYDDGFVTAIAVLDMLDRNPGKSMADLYRDLPRTWASPTMSPTCADEVKYAVADRVVERFKAMQARGEPLAGQPIRDLVTVNGVRVTVEDGAWGLVRASSNKPELSSSSRARLRKRACGRCSRRSTGSCARTPRSGPTTRRFEAMDAERARPCAARHVGAGA